MWLALLCFVVDLTRAYAARRGGEDCHVVRVRVVPTLGTHAGRNSPSCVPLPASEETFEEAFARHERTWRHHCGLACAAVLCNCAVRLASAHVVAGRAAGAVTHCGVCVQARRGSACGARWPPPPISISAEIRAGSVRPWGPMPSPVAPVSRSTHGWCER